jgi:hypothetical protein
MMETACSSETLLLSNQTIRNHFAEDKSHENISSLFIHIFAKDLFATISLRFCSAFTRRGINISIYKATSQHSSVTQDELGSSKKTELAGST